MPVYFSTISDVVLCAMSIAMLLAGVICLALSREKKLARPLASFRWLSLSLLIIAARDWYGILGLAEQAFLGFHSIGVVMLAGAAIPLLFAARQEIPATGRMALVHAAFGLALAVILGVVIAPYFDYERYVRSGQPLVSLELVTAAKVYFCAAAGLFLLCAARSAVPPQQGQMKALRIFLLYALLVLVSHAPGIPGDPDTDFVGWYVMPLVFVLRIAVAYALAGQFWSLHAKAIGVMGKNRWWPLVFVILMVAFGFLMVGTASYNHRAMTDANPAVARLETTAGADGSAQAAATPEADSGRAKAARIERAVEIYLFRRPMLLLLPGAMFVILLVFSGHQRAWLSARSTNQLEALKLGALGNELTGVLVTKGNTIIQANPRSSDLSGYSAEEMVGKDIRNVFDCVDPDLEAMTERIKREIRNKGSSLYETAFRTAGGNIVNTTIYVRKLNLDPDDNHLVWETVDITRQKEMERDLRSSRDRLQAIIDVLPGAVFVKDRHNRYQMANQAFANLLGLSAGTPVVGKGLDILKAEEAEFSHMHDEIAFDMRGGTLFYDRAMLVDGEERYLEITKTMRRWSAGPDDDVIIGTIHDVTARKHVEATLSTERHFLMQLLNTLRVAVCFIDEDRIIRLCNIDFAREAGAANPDELSGQNYDDANPFAADTAAADQAMLEKGSGYSDQDFEVSTASGTRNFILRRIVMRSPNGAVLGLVKTFRDTTDLVAAGRAAKKADRSKAAFLANMSHELRTPMNGIVGMADLIAQSEAAGAVHRLYAGTIIKSARTLQMVMDEVMDVATMDDEAKKIKLADAPFPLLSLAEEAADIVSCLAEAWGVELAFVYDFTLRPQYSGDARRLRQVLVQVLTHCSQLTADQKITLAAAPAAGGTGVAFRVTFLPRTGLDARTLDNTFKGAGSDAAAAAADSVNIGMFNDRIGLPLAWRIIRLMDGGLEVRESRGAIVCEITLPLTPDPQSPGAVKAPDLRGTRALVATGQPAREKALRTSLEYAGVKVGTLHDGQIRDALDVARAKGEGVDLLVIDGDFLPPDKLAEFVKSVRQQPAEAEAGANTATDAQAASDPAPHVVMLVRSREVQGLGEAGGLASGLIIPPVLPNELWLRVSGILDARAGKKKETDKRKSTRIIRSVRFPVDVLLVEDNAVNQMVEIGLLKRIGCRPVLARNGEEAVKRIAEGESYDIILMDCMMPVMDGYEATGRIRIHERGIPGAKRNTIVALTANTVAGDKEKCLASGMDDYLTKPVTFELVRGALQKHCSAQAVVVDETETA